MKTSYKKIDAESYSIFLGINVFSSLNAFLSQKQYINSKLFLLVDENTFKYCFPLITRSKKLKKAIIIIIKSGEKNKNIETCQKVWKELSSHYADRKSLLINLGGGVVSDLGGFAASIYKRGIDFINIPTTLLAQVDASIGGKTGIDLNNIKNEIGLFSFPKAVFVCPDFLNTLDKRQLLAGFAEIIKHALIADKNYWKKVTSIKNLVPENIEPLILQSIKIKNQIVLKDIHEKNIRKKLNFGHTIGHAIESFSLKKDKNSLSHGESIAIGMICESYLSCRENLLSKQELEEITRFVLLKYKYYVINPSSDKEIIKLMQHDKKNDNKNINFTLLQEIGQGITDKYCSIKSIKESLNYYRNQAK